MNFSLNCTTIFKFNYYFIPKPISLALDDGEGKNDGSVKGVSYFKCLPEHGVFVPPNKISKVWVYTTCYAIYIHSNLDIANISVRPFLLTISNVKYFVNPRSGSWVLFTISQNSLYWGSLYRGLIVFETIIIHRWHHIYFQNFQPPPLLNIFDVLSFLNSSFCVFSTENYTTSFLKTSYNKIKIPKKLKKEEEEEKSRD